MGGRSELFWLWSPSDRGLPDFEYDPVKSATNRDKHGVDFEEAKTMWLDERGKTLPAKSVSGEARYYLVARLRGKLHTAIWTLREGKIRLISVRRSRREEVRGYSESD